MYDTNRQDPLLLNYFNTAKDFIASFALFHETRLQKSDMQFVYTYLTNNTRIPFIPGQNENSWFDVMIGNKLEKYSLIQDFAYGSFLTLRDSLREYVSLLGFNFEPPLFGSDIPAECNKFNKAYVRDLFLNAKNLRDECVKQEKLSPREFEDALELGLESGTEFQAHFSAIYGDSFQTDITTRSSRTRGSRSSHMRQDLGIPLDYGYKQEYPSFLLISAQEGVSTKILTEEFNYGEAIGCPAGRLPTSDTRKEKIAFDSGLNVLGKRFHIEFMTKAIPWFRNLSEEERTQIFSEIELKKLHGIIWQEAINRLPEGQIAYGSTRHAERK